MLQRDTSSNAAQKENLARLGQHFFFDTRLSKNNSKSCATCHAPQFAFSDGYRKSSGIYADETQHNAPTLLNTHFLKTLTWLDKIPSYEHQMLKPLFSQYPPELGLDSLDKSIFSRFQNDSLYVFLYEKAFLKKIQTIDYEDIIKSIATYEHTLISFESAFDKNKMKPVRKDKSKGEQLFFGEKYQCNTCHSAPLFTNQQSYNIAIRGKNEQKYRTPTLRNIALTAPYMHDGSVEKLEDAVQHPFFLSNKKYTKMTDLDKKELLLFLHTLTDSTIFIKKHFQNPFY